MNFETNDSYIFIEKIDGENKQSWSFTKESFKIAYHGFEPLPENVIEWMNS